MILEAVLLQVKPGLETDYEEAFQEASPIIASMKGYLSHELHRCLELCLTHMFTIKWVLQDSMLPNNIRSSRP
jgi:heme-degrading monooxygenase HmoA